MAEKRKKIYADKTIRDLKAIQDMLMAAGDPFLAGVLNRAIGCVENQPEAMPENDGWISVEERLPQNYISVLVYIPTAEPLPMVHEAYIGDDGEWHSSVFYGIENEDVTHWMTMPKTPKEV